VKLVFGSLKSSLKSTDLCDQARNVAWELESALTDIIYDQHKVMQVSRAFLGHPQTSDITLDGHPSVPNRELFLLPVRLPRFN